METDYSEIFKKVENSLKKHSYFDEVKFTANYGRYKTFENRIQTDKELYQLLVTIIFYSGFRASTVEVRKNTILKHFPDHSTVSTYTDNEINAILADPEMIKNRRKIECCVTNAKIFKKITDEYGSFNKYLENFKPRESFENLIQLKEELEFNFDYLAGTTVYHFFADLGYNVLKPDRVILRIFKRLGLIENEKQLLKAVVQGRKFAEATGLPIRYIDIIFVKYGQEGKSNEFGLVNGICLSKNPSCNLCELTNCCQYHNEMSSKTN